MTILKKVSVLLTVLLIAFSVWLFNFSQEEEIKTSPQDDVLTAAINACDSVTERAASHLVAVVEFQKLEIAGRKARVFKLCMQDHGYKENENWLNYSTPLAEKVAKETNISIDEALENLRRVNMMQANDEEDRPTYWSLGNQATP